MKGEVKIEADVIKFGMILLGMYNVPLYPNDGIVWENEGGKCVFRGKCMIGNSSAISIGPNAELTFGNNFGASAMLKLTTYCKILFNDNVLLGWENTFLDTDFHKLTFLNTSKHKKAFAPIIIGENNWFGLKCITFKGTETPPYCIFGGGSILNKKYNFPPYSIIAGNPLRVCETGIYWNIDDDEIDYYSQSV